jgi:hypothetical protein
VAPEGSSAENLAKACAAIRDWYAIATNENVWNSQGDSEKIKMEDGRIYQMAYTNSWVSYPASERAKGLTGYQFRSPAEWFAELYAGYLSGKLKPSHPARKWLAALTQ